MKIIEHGLVGIIHYSVANSKGDILLSTFDSKPMPYLHGAGNIFSVLEKGLYGLKVGDTRKITVEPEAGYGVRDEELVFTVRRDELDEDIHDLKIGAHCLSRHATTGIHCAAFVVDFDEVNMTLDVNHPLAGECLYFDVEIVAIREPTPSEYNHGHPHSIYGEEPF